MPPLRLAILEDVAANPHTRTHDVRQRLNKPRNTIDRQLQALHMLGVLDCDEVEAGDGGGHSRWYYRVNERINPDVIQVPDLLPTKDLGTEESIAVVHISGT
jgi:predicted transcriptional regulator